MTSFEDWTELLEIENSEEVDCLYQSVKNISEYGLICTKECEKPGTYVVKASHVPDSLFLASEDARSAFLKFIEGKYCGGEIEEVWYAVESANAKED